MFDITCCQRKRWAFLFLPMVVSVFIFVIKIYHQSPTYNWSYFQANLIKDGFYGQTSHIVSFVQPSSGSYARPRYSKNDVLRCSLPEVVHAWATHKKLGKLYWQICITYTKPTLGQLCRPAQNPLEKSLSQPAVPALYQIWPTPDFKNTKMCVVQSNLTGVDIKFGAAETGFKILNWTLTNCARSYITFGVNQFKTAFMATWL